MIYTPMTMKAMKYAYEAHSGQVDCGNVPYIFHPYHLAEQMEDEVSCTVALLHDVVEDTEITLEDLKMEFPPEVVEAVGFLTHDEAVDYFDYINNLKNHPIARKVKLADLVHNSNEDRIRGCNFTEEEKNNWKEKYARAKALLLGGESH